MRVCREVELVLANSQGKLVGLCEMGCAEINARCQISKTEDVKLLNDIRSCHVQASLVTC
jgi:hypothetical protein